MKRIHLHLTDQQQSALRRLAERTGLTVAELVRRAVDGMIEMGGNGDGCETEEGRHDDR